MDGVGALYAVLTASIEVTALVPEDRIQAGNLPQGTDLPALSIGSISKLDRNIPNPGDHRHVSERVQVTIHAKDYPSQKAVEKAVRSAAADTFPALDGLVNVTIHTDGAGPDFMNEQASIYLGSQDFIVTYSEER